MTTKPRRLTRIVSALSLVAAACVLHGCVSTVRGPATVDDPAQVLLVKDARHLGLILPRDGATHVEFGYGDWDWYAEMDDSWYHVFDTVLLPTQATLATREIPAASTDEVRRRFHWMRISELTVSRGAVDGLLAELDAMVAAHESQRVHNPVYRLDFIPVDDSYWLFRNCNDVVADWLRELGCSVTPLPVRVGLSVEETAVR